MNKKIIILNHQEYQKKILSMLKDYVLTYRKNTIFALFFKEYK